MIPTIGPFRPWTDPRITAINRMDAHVPIERCDVLRLDGPWRFELFDSPDVVPAEAVRGEGLTVRAEVPGDWTLHPDVDDLPWYTNVQMPFDGPPPRLPERNPTGVYHRFVDLPEQWAGRPIVLHVDGAESVHAVFVDGEFVGYGTDSRLPSEYDLSGHLTPGRPNGIAIVVVRFSAMSYLEDQDQWWMGGLHRPVWIECRPSTHLSDVRVTTDFDPSTGDGLVTATVEVASSFALEPDWSVELRLLDPDGTAVGPSVERVVPHDFQATYRFFGHHVQHRWDLTPCRPWSAERPDRYELHVELRGPAGDVVETCVQRVGATRVEVVGRELLFNGKPIWVFGVNRHDHHPDRGKALTVDDLRADLVQMRRHNITAVRTAHYPNRAEFYDLCDELGMYVIDEANVENHAFNTSLCDDEAYRSAYVERVARMVQRDRNHPSVIAWSLGNESGYGSNHDAAAAWVRRTDPSRPVHYEGAIFHGDDPTEDGGLLPGVGRVDRTAEFRPTEPNWNWVRGGLLASDLVCPMYPPIEAIRQYGADGLGTRPLIMCEYSHAMGNSNGSLADYWDVITTTPGLQGGFIWEWKDHGLRHRRVSPDGRLLVGGDFGERPHDGNFVADGLVSSDLEPHPALAEVAHVYRPVTVDVVDGALRITNRRSFVGIDDLVATWTLVVGAAVRAEGVLAVGEVCPREGVTVPIPCDVPETTEPVHLTVTWTLAHDTWFGAVGDLVAREQVVLREGTWRCPATAEVDPDRGEIVRLDDVLSRPVEPSLRRASTDNDGFKLMPELSQNLTIGGQAWQRWRAAGLYELDPPELVELDHRVETVREDVVEHHLRVVVPDDLADLPRVGVRFGLPERFSEMRWFGRGPHENYPDRKRSAVLSEWACRIDEQPYLVPQEFGLRTDVRWWEAIDPSTDTIVRIDVLEPSFLHVGAIRHTADDLQAATNQLDLVPRNELVVHVDVAHRGLGTASCGPDVLAPYRLPAGTYELVFRLTSTVATRQAVSWPTRSPRIPLTPADKEHS